MGHDKRILVPHYNGRERRVRTALRDLTTLGDPDDDGYSPPRVEEGVKYPMIFVWTGLSRVINLRCSR